MLVFIPAGDWLGESLIDVDTLTKADYVVVLDGNRERGVEAANLYREGWAPKVIVSSTNRGVTGLADLVKAHGVPVEDILLDGETTRTTTHPEAVARLPGVDIESDRFIILTSPYHTSRSRACFQHYGYKNICMQSPGWRLGGRYRDSSTGWGQRTATLYEKIYEVIGWGVYRIRGWV
ncbi:MAG: YdcF family protein [Phycisphaerales bacterium]|nr:YdcF family protein [Phycisphaerales bacterium]